MGKKELEILSRSPLRLFFKYATLDVIGLLAISSSGIVDAFFVGKYVGEHALASVNIVVPTFAFAFGFIVMIVIGSAVRVGKYLGEGNQQKASEVFTMSIVAIFVLYSIVVALVMMFSEQLVMFLGSNEELKKGAITYLLIATPFQMMGSLVYSFAVYARIDNRPIISTSAILSASILNVPLNILFVVYLDMGIAGSATATGVSYIPAFITLLIYFLKFSRLKFSRKMGGIKGLLTSSFNGSSEFLTECSGAIVMIMFNGVMMKMASSAGVAAFTVINYSIWIVSMVTYGIADSLISLISINFGAKRMDRVYTFLKLSVITSFSIGVIAVTLLTVFDSQMVSIFLKDKNSNAFHISLEFLHVVKYAFLLIGVNSCLSSYFTALHMPVQSLLIALSRSVILPISMLLIMPMFFGKYGAYSAIVVANSVTFIFALYLLYLDRKNRTLAVK